MANVSTYPIPAQLGYVEPLQVTAPGAGNEFTITRPSQERFRILSLHYLFTADANVANRRPGLRIHNKADTYDLTRLHTDYVTAGQAFHYLWLPDGAPKSFTTPPEDWIYLRLPFIEFNDSLRIGSNTIGIQVGDAYTQISLIIVAWQDQGA